MMTFRGHTYRYSAGVFLRLLGGVYLLAFYSLWTQVYGLIGQNGILPASSFFDLAAGASGLPGLLQYPSVLWWLKSDAALGVLGVLGMGVSALMMFGLLPLFSAAAAWVLYLSLAVGGQAFFIFPWDNLLLEAGLLAILLAPPVWRSRAATNPMPSRLVIFLLHWLLFRLLFSAGYDKLFGSDVSWRDMTALVNYFWAQPLPTWTAWYMQQIPLGLLKAGAVLVLFIELVVPFFIFASRWLRATAFVFLLFLQLASFATGNYGYLNILAMVLCIPLLDDRWFAAADRGASTHPGPAGRAWLLAVIRMPVAVMVLVVSMVEFATLFYRNLAWPTPLRGVAATVAAFRAVNHYESSAAIMSKRPEIVLEGSRDGKNWLAYELPYKPGTIHRTPLFVAPHMPRLDWQMWHAAHGTPEAHPWLRNLMKRLLEGQPDVLDLFEVNPFGVEPPLHVRAVLYHYTFASPEENKRDHRWWNRELQGLYCPMVSRPP